jgi:hypothetical protein
MRSAPEPADAILELILRLEQEASDARSRLRASLGRLGLDSEMTTSQLAETLRGLGAESQPLIERPDYVVRIIPPAAPSELLRVSVKAGLAHHHADEHVLMVPLEAETPDEEASTGAAAAAGFHSAVYACPRCGGRVTIALLHEQQPH